MKVTISVSFFFILKVEGKEEMEMEREEFKSIASAVYSKVAYHNIIIVFIFFDLMRFF